MTSIISYRKVTDDWTTYALALPETGQGDGPRCTELATIAGITYVAVPDGIDLPPQPEQIAQSVERVTITDELRDQIKAASTHCAFIAEQVQQKIRARYSPDAEAYFARVAGLAALGAYELLPDEKQRLLDYSAYVEDCRGWGRAERLGIGL